MVCFFFFNDTATTEIYTLSLHDALPISNSPPGSHSYPCTADTLTRSVRIGNQDRKSTRLNSSHSQISYAVFCLKKKKCTRYSKRVALGATTIHVNVSSTPRRANVSDRST